MFNFCGKTNPAILTLCGQNCKYFKCGESGLLDGRRDHMSMYKVPPRFPRSAWTPPPLRLRVPSFHSKKLNFCAEGRFIEAQVSVTLAHTLPCEGRAGPGVRVAAPHARARCSAAQKPAALELQRADRSTALYLALPLSASILFIFWGVSSWGRG